MAIMLTIGQSEPIIVNYFINAAPQNERPIQAFVIGNLELALASIEGAPSRGLRRLTMRYQSHQNCRKYRIWNSKAESTMSK